MRIELRETFVRELGARARALGRQLPYAQARALTALAKDVQAAESAAILANLDRPTPFTQRAVAVEAARKDTLTARVYLRPVQAAYLGLQVTGGTRTPKRRALVLPAPALPLNQYGNMPRGKLRRLLQRRDVFSGSINGTAGLWQRRRGRPPVLLIAYEPKATYKPRLPFYEVAAATVARNAAWQLAAAIAAALATSR